MPDPIRAGGDSPFVYRKADEDQSRLIREGMAAFEAVYDYVMREVPPSRERSLAITKLEEAAMWSNKAIAFNPRQTAQP